MKKSIHHCGYDPECAADEKLLDAARFADSNVKASEKHLRDWQQKAAMKPSTKFTCPQCDHFIGFLGADGSQPLLIECQNPHRRFMEVCDTMQALSGQRREPRTCPRCDKLPGECECTAGKVRSNLTPPPTEGMIKP